MAKKRGPGRPPTGSGGEKVSSYRPLTIRLPPARRAALEALSAIRGDALWQVVDEALERYLKALPASERRLVGEVVKKRGR